MSCGLCIISFFSRVNFITKFLEMIELRRNIVRQKNLQEKDIISLTVISLVEVGVIQFYTTNVIGYLYDRAFIATTDYSNFQMKI